MKPKALELPRLLHPAKFAATTRIARLEPYDPNKTVVLLVHGLMDSPATWFPLINHLCADEGVHRKYQFWFVCIHLVNPGDRQVGHGVRPAGLRANGLTARSADEYI
jgi:pimeloyl-ACP methyl ester carboxylesterase